MRSPASTFPQLFEQVKKLPLGAHDADALFRVAFPQSPSDVRDSLDWSMCTLSKIARYRSEERASVSKELAEADATRAAAGAVWNAAAEKKRRAAEAVETVSAASAASAAIEAAAEVGPATATTSANPELEGTNVRVDDDTLGIVVAGGGDTAIVAVVAATPASEQLILPPPPQEEDSDAPPITPSVPRAAMVSPGLMRKPDKVGETLAADNPFADAENPFA